MADKEDFKREVRRTALLTLGLAAALVFGFIVLVTGDWIPGTIIVVAAFLGLAEQVVVIRRLCSDQPSSRGRGTSQPTSEGASGPRGREGDLAGVGGRAARTCCRVVGHTGDWTSPDERCVRVRMCERCGEVTNEQAHTWTAFEYVASNRCERERRCDRCGAVESRIVHEWGPWHYAGTQQHFRQCHTCRRCGAEEYTRYLPRIV